MRTEGPKERYEVCGEEEALMMEEHGKDTKQPSKPPRKTEKRSMEENYGIQEDIFLYIRVYSTI